MKFAFLNYFAFQFGSLCDGTSDNLFFYVCHVASQLTIDDNNNDCKQSAAIFIHNVQQLA